jgi:cardiolipin synthase
VIDGDLAFTGGMNVGNAYSGFLHKMKKKSPRPWRDTHLSIHGPAARDLACIFAEDWTFTTGERLIPDVPLVPEELDRTGAIMAILPSGPDQKRNASSYAYFAGIASARERVFLTSPYFVPDEATMVALESAALRGVDVRLLVPSLSDVPVASAAAWSFFPPLLESGVRIYTYGASILHAKTVVVDGAWGLVGSANLDIRSFAYNFEAGALIQDPAFAEELTRVFFTDLECSQEVTTKEWYSRSRFWRLKVSLARLVSPML